MKERAEKRKVPSVKSMAEKHDVEALKKKALGESTCLPYCRRLTWSYSRDMHARRRCMQADKSISLPAIC